MNRILVAGLVSVVAGACGHVQTTISLQELDCGSCSDGVVKILEKQPGVQDARFALAAAEVTVRHDPEKIAAAALVAALDRAGFQSVLGAGHGSYEVGPEFAAGLDVVTVTSTGQRFAFADALVPGKVTVLDFGAVWCAPCRKLDAIFATQLEKRSNLALRKVNIVDWDSPVAKQHLVGVAELPYVVVFGPDGRTVAKITGLKEAALVAAIEEAGR